MNALAPNLFNKTRDFYNEFDEPDTSVEDSVYGTMIRVVLRVIIIFSVSVGLHF